MPKSQIRKKKVYTPPPDVLPSSTATSRKPSPTWVPITAIAMIAVGILWLVVFYLSEGAFPVRSWEYWNLGIGFGAMVGSLFLLARWR